MKGFWFSIWFLLGCMGLAQSPIQLLPNQVINLSTQGNAWHLFDEQNTIKSTAHLSKSEPLTAFNPGYNKLYNPASVVVDLREDYQLSQLWFYDSNGKDTIRIYSGTPGNWIFQKQIITDSYRTWRSIPFNFHSRLLRLEFRWPQAQVNEVVLFGRPLGSNTYQAPKPIKVRQPSMDKLIGINAFVDDPIWKVEQVAGTVREYHRWQWDEGNDEAQYRGYPKGKFAWNPSYAGGWNFDEFYRELHLRGMDISPCLQSQPLYLRAHGNADAKPLRQNADPEHPESYRAHADYLFQFAARYGGRKVPAHQLKLKGNQPVKSGLNYLHSVENWNEPDKWWRGPHGYFTPFAFAAMCSADYDGHCGSLGETYGLKNADPELIMVMAGLAGLNIEYIKGMLLWSEFNRKDGSFPADVLNFHHYSNDAGGQGGKASHGISPEADSLKFRLQELVRFRDAYLPGKPIWLSEFGYDTNPESVQGVRGEQAERKQAEWLIRSFLEIAASGIDRAQVFMLRDVNAQNPVKYNSSGLTREKWNNHRPKKSFFMLSAFKSLMTGFYFKREVPTGLYKIHRYEFYNPQTDEYLWAVWSSADAQGETKDIGITVPGGDIKLWRLPVSGSASADREIDKGQQAKFQLPVGTTPQFIVFTKNKGSD